MRCFHRRWYTVSGYVLFLQWLLTEETECSRLKVIEVPGCKSITSPQQTIWTDDELIGDAIKLKFCIEVLLSIT
ncbi:MAG: hypothetical protein V7L27_15640 [Nostoc sp.]|uniref:hypothetical protein n=1 Tax=Nostoc sp. TaxID=1180 RepID=UPI002FF68264